MVALGCVAALVAVLLGGLNLTRTDGDESTPPFVQQRELGDGYPPVEDPRANPAFDEAYSIVCGQTLIELDAMYAALAAGSSDPATTINALYQALTQRMNSVYVRADLWSATDLVVLGHAETIADDLAAILNGTDTGLDDLNGDVALFRSVCEDWYVPA